MSEKLTIRPTTERDCEELAEALRAEDFDELTAITDMPALDVLLVGLRTSEEVLTIECNGRVMAIYGVQGERGPDRVGFGWLLTSDMVERHPKAFWKACLAELPRLLSQWGTLINAIHCHHYKALRWARKLGFTMEPPAPLGPRGDLFVRFSISKENLHVRTSSSGGNHGGRGGVLDVRQQEEG